MKVYTEPAQIKFEKGSAITIGTFDGVHIGHKKIISRLKAIAAEYDLESLVFTFNPHPRLVLFPDQKDLKLITTNNERAELFEKEGIKHLLEFPFTKEFSQIDPEKYVREILVNQLKMKRIVIGYDHRFGHNREGSIKLLKELETKYDFIVEEISAQEIDEINISSTRIRRALEEGNIKQANAYLGYPYFITGTVVEGKKLGRQLGYPTANIEVNDIMKLIPQIGIYAVIAEIDGERKKGMMCIGKNPTTDTDNKIKIEVNILDFNGDLYGMTIRVHLIDFLRHELKFEGLEALKDALADDRIRTLDALKEFE